eukprot:1096577-Pyramimonas_sp.AAC.1
METPACDVAVVVCRVALDNAAEAVDPVLPEKPAEGILALQAILEDGMVLGGAQAEVRLPARGPDHDVAANCPVPAIDEQPFVERPPRKTCPRYDAARDPCRRAPGRTSSRRLRNVLKHAIDETRVHRPTHLRAHCLLLPQTEVRRRHAVTAGVSSAVDVGARNAGRHEVNLRLL